MLAEQQTEYNINNILENNGWIIKEAKEKNVYFQKARPEHQSKLEILSKKKSYKKPDYILYHGSNPIGIIEAKAGGKPLKEAMKQAEEYAQMLEAPLIFASNGSYVETKHLITGKELCINGEEVNRFIKYKEAIKFIEEGTNEIYTISKELIKAKEQLIPIFKKINDLLRKANIFSGYDRISEFSNILFLKLISEQQGEKSWWNSIKKQDDDLLFETINGTIIKQLESKYGGDVFNKTSIEKPSLFRQIMSMIDPLILSEIKTDIKGDAFEYFLKNMNQADNDLGQYFTPRHIVSAMVHLVDPKFKETIYDPFCGTGGFLIESFNHIKENTILETEEDKKILSENTLFGRDATKVSTIAKKNMILHGDGHSNIEKTDSLENPIEGKYNCVITNIPFSLKDVDYSHLYYESLAKKNGDAICVLHCLKALKEGGRMALIVPEGFLFKKELKEVRKRILKEANLELVISLPQGVFQPYTGVKTDILYFTNAHKPKPAEGYYYFEVKNDGYTLDNHRRKIAGANDIHKLESSNLKKSEKELLLANGFEFIPFEKIKEHDYNLVGSRYREISKHNGKWEMVKLSDICVEIKNGVNVEQNKFEGKYRVSRIESISIGYFNIEKTSFTNDEAKENDFLQNGDILFSHINSFEHLAKTAIYQENFKYKVIHGINLVKFRPNKERAIPEYLSFVMRAESFISEAKSLGQRAVNQASIRLSELKELSIPLPPLDEQKKIVSSLEQIQNSINSLEESIKNLKAEGGGSFLHFSNQEYEILQLRDVVEIKGGKRIPKGCEYTSIKTDYPYIRIEDFKDGTINYNNLKYIDKSIHDLIKKYVVNTEDVLISIAGTTGCIAIITNELDGKNFTENAAKLIIKNSNQLTRNYLAFILQTQFCQQQIKERTKAITIPKLALYEIEEIKIPLPPLHIQEEIVVELERNDNFVKQAQEMVKLQKQKLAKIISNLFKA